MTTTATYAVTGMSCQHCIDAVTAEVGRLAGVEQVQVDLPAGAVTVTSGAPLDLEQVRAAIDEAGYDLAEPAAGVELEPEPEP
jgi:copper ion binding protein